MLGRDVFVIVPTGSGKSCVLWPCHSFLTAWLCRHGQSMVCTRARHHERSRTSPRKLPLYGSVRHLYPSFVYYGSKEEHNCKHSSLAWRWLNWHTHTHGSDCVHSCGNLICQHYGVRTKESVNRCQTPLFGRRGLGTRLGRYWVWIVHVGQFRGQR